MISAYLPLNITGSVADCLTHFTVTNRRFVPLYFSGADAALYNYKKNALAVHITDLVFLSVGLERGAVSTATDDTYRSDLESGNQLK